MAKELVAMCWLIDFPTPPMRLVSVDHIVPVTAGGTEHLGNLQTLYWPCNSFKGARVE